MSEPIIWSFDGTEEFYNKNHSKTDGRFTSGPSGSTGTKPKLEKPGGPIKSTNKNPPKAVVAELNKLVAYYKANGAGNVKRSGNVVHVWDVDGTARATYKWSPTFGLQAYSHKLKEKLSPDVMEVLTQVSGVHPGKAKLASEANTKAVLAAAKLKAQETSKVVQARIKNDAKNAPEAKTVESWWKSLGNKPLTEADLHGDAYSASYGDRMRRTMTSMEDVPKAIIEALGWPGGVSSGFRDYTEGREPTMKELVALGFYASSGYKAMNRLLREDTIAEQHGKMRSAVEQVNSHLKSFIDTQQTTEPMQVSRWGLLPKSVTPGTRIQDKGFVSTAKGGYGIDIGSSPDDRPYTLMHINVPKGSKATFVGDFEYELLLQAGSTFEYKGTKDYNGQSVHVLDLVSQP